MIKLYGIAASRAFRPMWLMQEINLPYELISVDFRKGENRSLEYLAINPNGLIPTLIDDELVLHESMAINLYLAKKYGGELYPDDPTKEALANMWSFWVMSEVEYSLLTALMHTRMLPDEQRDTDKASRNIQMLEGPFTILDNALADKPYLLGDTFSIADLNVAAVIGWCRPARIKLDRWPNLKNWLDACITRPAYKQAMRK